MWTSNWSLLFTQQKVSNVKSIECSRFDVILSKTTDEMPCEHVKQANSEK